MIREVSHVCQTALKEQSDLGVHYLLSILV